MTCSACAGEDEGDEEMSRRANGLRSRGSWTLSESGGSRDLEDDAQEAMQEMLGAQEWHQVPALVLVFSRLHGVLEPCLVAPLLRHHCGCLETSSRGSCLSCTQKIHRLFSMPLSCP